MHTLGIGDTHQGQVRTHNEDSFEVDDELGLYVVADGMGGHAAGEVASALAIETVKQTIAEGRETRAAVARGELPSARLVALAERAVLDACAVVHERAKSKPGLAGMGCTLTMLLTAGARGVMAHVGDSRIYMLRAGKVYRLSTDHNLADEMMRAGMLTAEKARKHPFAHTLTRNIGLQPAVQVDTLEIALTPGDRFVLCSDGLSNYVPDDAALSELTPEPLKAAATALVEFANSKGGADNISVVVVDVGPANAPTPDSTLRRQQALAAVAQCSLFEGLPLRSRARLFSTGRVFHVPAGERVVSEAQALHELHICLKGRLEVRAAGRPPREVAAGGVYGHSTLFHERPARAAVVAAVASDVLVIERAKLMRLFRQRPRLGVGVLERLLKHGSRHEDPV